MSVIDTDSSHVVQSIRVATAPEELVYLPDPAVSASRDHVWEGMK